MGAPRRCRPQRRCRRRRWRAAGAPRGSHGTRCGGGGTGRAGVTCGPAANRGGSRQRHAAGHCSPPVVERAHKLGKLGGQAKGLQLRGRGRRGRLAGPDLVMPGSRGGRGAHAFFSGCWGCSTAGACRSGGCHRFEPRRAHRLRLSLRLASSAVASTASCGDAVGGSDAQLQGAAGPGRQEGHAPLLRAS